jgi:hypothetical protein
MSKRASAMAVSHELSSDVAIAILTTLSQSNRDPDELMEIVLAVHSTLQELAVNERDRRWSTIDRYGREH